MATQQSETAGNPSAPPSAFRNAFDAFLGAGTDIAVQVLQTRGERYLAQENAQTQVAVQQTYNNLARQSPNLGPNEVAPASRQAVEQTKLMTGIDLNSPGLKQMLMFGIAAIIGAFIIFKLAKK